MGHRMNNLIIDLSCTSVKILIQALNDREKILLDINNNSDNENLAIDAGNDCIALTLLKNEIIKDAVSLYGESVLNFSNEYI